MLTHGDTVMNSEHPPMDKILSGLFVLPLRPDIDKALREVPGDDQWRFGDVFLFESGNPTDAMMFMGRLPTVILTILLLVLVWLWIAKNIHPWAGVGAVASLALNPNILAHGALTTNDLHLTFATWLVFIATYSVCKKPKYSSFIWLGLAIGVILLAKFSGVLLALIALAVVLAILITRKTAIKKIVLGFLLTAVFCIGLIWVGYASIEYKAVFSRQTVSVVLPIFDVVQIKNPLVKIVTLPILRYQEGFDVLKNHNAMGHKSYLNGDYSMEGFKSYFILSVYYKTPTVILLLAVVGLVWAICKKQWVIVSLVAVGIIFVAAASMGRIHIGMRHVLPFFVLVAPAAGFAFWQIIESRNKVLYCLLSAAIIWWVADLALNGPNTISFFTQTAGGWRNGYKHLIDSNTDWGQEMKLVVKWAKEHPDKDLLVGYATGENPKYRGVKFTNITDLGTQALCDGLKENQVLLVSINTAMGLFGRYPCIFDKISKADRLGYTYLILYPDDFK